ncbi:dTDP-4-dehydrorhamnose 3,5-epimerase [Paenibacillus sp. KACC 21273]|uniref:dTDP-4-dehydrorhamnose 3,5-epimerase n=1 Tax=Paenibacillus sp. KACC 21273 TaxID=3025665 RepID=UPI0023658F6E|nr:dTDP-4-dehydrorhamnose 3,5-epimerase [Paenibacillus sp. KACC 21273]WDF51490.1 dTDP-4-dehydrorhamnose 3,5-epimerase [Paenibacillus sp. KACC 21273]
MIIESTPLKDAFIFKQEPIEDERGYFSRTFCRKTLNTYGIEFEMVQSNMAFNRYSKTLRGMHFQKPPFSEQKIVSCLQGAIYDVIIDIRLESPTFGQWFGTMLSKNNMSSLYIPKGFAHGYQTLEDNSSISYMVSENYTPSHESGIRWNDEAFKIDWPVTDGLLVSDKDRNWIDFRRDIDGIR